MVKVPAFTDIGKAAKELLYGGKEGTFQFNQAVSLSSRTADGVEFAISTIKKDDRVEPNAKVSYKTPEYSVLASFTASGKVITSVSRNDIAPGLTATISGAIPDQSSAKLALEYLLPHLTLRTNIGLTSAPKVDLAATTGYKNLVLGGAASYDTALAKVTTWSLASGYNSLDYQVGLVLSDNELLTASYAHNIDATSTAGAEIVRLLDKETTAFTLGYSKRLDGGALTKAKLDNAGIASFLYETELKPKTKAAYSVQFDATDLAKPAKFGLLLDLKN